MRTCPFLLEDATDRERKAAPWAVQSEGLESEGLGLNPAQLGAKTSGRQLKLATPLLSHFQNGDTAQCLERHQKAVPRVGKQPVWVS